MVAGVGFRTNVGFSRRFYRPLPLAARATCHAAQISILRRGETIPNLPTTTSQPTAGRVNRFGTMGRSSIVEWSSNVAAESSFDIVSKVDRQEVDNALNQAAKEVRQRFDFKNTDASIQWSGQAIEMEANSEERVKAVLDVFQSKLIRRGVSLKALDPSPPRWSGRAFTRSPPA